MDPFKKNNFTPYHSIFVMKQCTCLQSRQKQHGRSLVGWTWGERSSTRLGWVAAPILSHAEHDPASCTTHPPLPHVPTCEEGVGSWPRAAFQAEHQCSEGTSLLVLESRQAMLHTMRQEKWIAQVTPKCTICSVWDHQKHFISDGEWLLYLLPQVHFTEKLRDYWCWGGLGSACKSLPPVSFKHCNSLIYPANPSHCTLFLVFEQYTHF